MDWATINKEYVKLSQKWADDISVLALKEKPDPLGGHFLDFSKKGEAALAYMERGQVTSRKAAKTVDGLLYLIFKGQAKARALDYEAKNRISGQDSRRLYFSTSIKELAKISEEWSQRLQKEFNVILKEHPFVDDLPLRIESN